MNANPVGTPLIFVLASIAIILTTALSGQAATYKVVHHFTGGADGLSPSWGAIQDSEGNLFGTTYGGGEFQGGVVFKFSPSNDGTWSETVIYDFDFNSNIGGGPASGVTLDHTGNLFGGTVSGGPNDSGTAFELSPAGNGWAITPIYTKNGAGNMILDRAGNLFSPLGPGDNMGGAIGELSPAPGLWTYSLLHSFCQIPGCKDGILPQGPLAWDSAGNLYGNTINGGIYKYPTPCPDDEGCGLVFQMRPRPGGAWSFRILYWFGAFVGDGLLLNGGLVVDGKGNVFGSTEVGGPTGTGTVFELSPEPQGRKGSSTLYAETQLYTFPDCSLGCGPFGVLTRDRAGNLYGAGGGGSQSCGGYCGVVYKLSPQQNGTWKYTLLHAFNGSDGAGPYGVTVGADGNLYGTTIAGGQFNHGVAFEITP